MSLKDMVGKRQPKVHKFCGEDVKIFKLSVAQVKEIQDLAKDLEKSPEDGGLKILKCVIKNGVDGGADLTDEDFDGLPMEELSTLSNAVMKWSGFDSDKGK